MLQKIELFYTVYTCTFQLPNKSNKYKIIVSSAHVIVHTTTHPFILHINMQLHNLIHSKFHINEKQDTPQTIKVSCEDYLSYYEKTHLNWLRPIKQTHGKIFHRAFQVSLSDEPISWSELLSSLLMLLSHIVESSTFGTQYNAQADAFSVRAFDTEMSVSWKQKDLHSRVYLIIDNNQ